MILRRQFFAIERTLAVCKKDEAMPCCCCNQLLLSWLPKSLVQRCSSEPNKQVATKVENEWLHLAWLAVMDLDRNEPENAPLSLIPPLFLLSCQHQRHHLTDTMAVGCQCVGQTDVPSPKALFHQKRLQSWACIHLFLPYFRKALSSHVASLSLYCQQQCHTHPSSTLWSFPSKKG